MGNPRTVIRWIATIIVVLTGAWATLALWYPLHGGWAGGIASAAWLLLLAVLLRAYWRRGPGALVAYGVVFTLLLSGFVVLPPRAHRDWADDVARTATAQVEGDSVTVHDVRNFDWRTEDDHTVRWETRHYDLRTLSSVDLVLSYWGGPTIAHTLVSFGFSDGSHLVFSEEIRKERTESFSAVGGFFKQFEASVIAADERDILRVRTNVRGEDGYLFHVAMPPAARRTLFLEYLAEANRVALRPRWYNTVTANCTTIIYSLVKKITPALPLDWRLLATGHFAEYAYDQGGLDRRYSYAELRHLGRFTDRARATGPAGDFSAAIRRGLPPLAEAPAPAVPAR